jgi:hypothetical protein
MKVDEYHKNQCHGTIIRRRTANVKGTPRRARTGLVAARQLSGGGGFSIAGESIVEGKCIVSLNLDGTLFHGSACSTLLLQDAGDLLHGLWIVVETGHDRHGFSFPSLCRHEYHQGELCAMTMDVLIRTESLVITMAVLIQRGSLLMRIAAAIPEEVLTGPQVNEEFSGVS